MKTTETEYCSAADLAELLGISRARIGQLLKEGVVTRITPGKYDKNASITAYCGMLRASLLQQGSGSSNAHLKASRVELLDMQKKNAELAYLEKTGQMLKIDDVEAILIEGAATFAGQKRSMGSRLAGKLASMTDPTAILKLLNAENDAILRNTSDKFSEIKNLGKGRRNTQAATKQKSKRVGRRKPGVSARKSGAGAASK